MSELVRPVLLSGLRVLDLTLDESFLCGRILTGLGAYVTRVESGSGKAGSAHIWGKGDYALMRLAFEKAGGRVVDVDLETAPGQQLIKQLAASADCLFEAFRPGYLGSLGLGYSEFQAINPRLIVVSITGFGQSGPRCDWVSCDLTLAALGGQLYVSGESGKPPLKLYGQQVEHLGVLFAVNGLLLAIHRRNQTGRGQQVDVSLQECVSAALDHVLPRYFGDGVVTRRQGSLAWNGSFKVFRCKDRYLLVSLPFDREMLAELVANGENDGDSVEGKGGQVLERQIGATRAIGPAIERLLKNFTSEELFRKAQLRRLPWAPVLTTGELLKNDQLKSRSFFQGIKISCRRRAVVPRPLPFLVTVAPKVGTADVDRCRMDNIPVLPLGGIRVLDFTWVMAGPYATRLLADFGAEVIKVQSRFVPGTEATNRTSYFKYWNRGKTSITLNMSHPESIVLARRLVGLSDVLIESFSPRVMDNWGLTREVLLQEKPDLIMVSMPAFGRTGPWRDCVAFGPTVHALSGLT
ncbi:MAG: CoA transferase, partial [Dehalococcoidia bacterium]|nr:CoA transferase [Dehalococcoidia bacterium]